MRTWFITGAARGFGPAIAERALELGDAVVATVRNPAYMTAAVGERERLLVLPFDVTNEAQARGAVASAIERFGRIDVLVNNAGYGVFGAIEEAGAAEVERVFRTNVFGLLNVTRAVLPQLRRQRSGHIVNIPSIGSSRAAAGWGIYCATKFAVEAISEALSKEGEPLGIYTTVVEPGCFGSDLRPSPSVVRTAQRIDDYRETVGASRTSAVGANRLRQGDPDELADAILSLVEARNPPRRLPFDRDDVGALEARHESGMRELEPWRSLVLSADLAS